MGRNTEPEGTPDNTGPGSEQTSFTMIFCVCPDSQAVEVRLRSFRGGWGTCFFSVKHRPRLAVKYLSFIFTIVFPSFLRQDTDTHEWSFLKCFIENKTVSALGIVQTGI